MVQLPTQAPAASNPPALVAASHKWQGPRVLVYLDGLGSRGSCPVTSGENVPAANLGAISNAVQAAGGTDLQTVAFSYGGAWRDCATGKSYAASSYPVVPAQGGALAVLSPSYEASDTCGGVAASAKGLGSLVSRVLSVEPDAGVILVGHSFGGMVVDYYAATAKLETASHLLAVISIDSPLLGIDLSGFSPDLMSNYKGACALDSLTWLDIRGASRVAGEIAKLGSSPLANRAFAVNATVIGQAISGTRWWFAPCAPYGGLFGIGHNCPLTDESSLAHIAAIANGDALVDFQVATMPEAARRPE